MVKFANFQLKKERKQIEDNNNNKNKIKVFTESNVHGSFETVFLKVFSSLRQSHPISTSWDVISVCSNYNPQQTQELHN